jgi:hypothetical protein
MIHLDNVELEEKEELSQRLSFKQDIELQLQLNYLNAQKASLKL